MGDGRIFLKTGRDASFRKDLSNEPNFDQIHLAGQYLKAHTKLFLENKYLIIGRKFFHKIFYRDISTLISRKSIQSPCLCLLQRPLPALYSYSTLSLAGRVSLSVFAVHGVDADLMFLSLAGTSNFTLPFYWDLSRSFILFLGPLLRLSLSLVGVLFLPLFLVRDLYPCLKLSTYLSSPLVSISHRHSAWCRCPCPGWRTCPACRTSSSSACSPPPPPPQRPEPDRGRKVWGRIVKNLTHRF